jgi:hypothetical protein
MKPEDVKQFFVDKSKWGDGPWQLEPDRLDFEHAGLPCLLHRSRYGVWCGYVGLPPGHPCYGKQYDDVSVDVHGGLTYANSCEGTICHVPKPGEPDEVWWLGFDCGHGGDYTPTDVEVYGHIRGERYDHAKALATNAFFVEVYRTIEYVKAETEQLAEQLAALGKSPSADAAPGADNREVHS